MSEAPKAIPAVTASPAATGGAGTVFEQHVDGSFLALLLVGGIPPILKDCQITEVALQTERLGWSTDDVLLVGLTGGGTERRLACQVKRTFTVSATDVDCRKAFGDFWTDFTNRALFHRGVDQFALVTFRGTNRLLGDLGGLLDTARAARDAADFAHRMATPGFMTSAATRDCGTIRSILDAANDAPVSDADFWEFLKHLHLVHCDLTASGSQTEASMKTLLAHTAVGPDRLAAADRSWDALIVLAAAGMPQAARLTREALPADLLARHTPVPTSDHTALAALRDHGVPILHGIRTVIGADYHLERDQIETQVIDALAQHRVVLVTGPAGSGKSAVAKNVWNHIAATSPAFAFRAEEFTQPHLDRVLLDSHVRVNTAQLAALLAGQGRKIVLVESVERLLEASVRDAFMDLLGLVQRDESWSLLLTCRDYSLDVVRSSLLEHAALPHAVIEVPPLSDGEIDAVTAAIPSLARPAGNPALRRLFGNPYNLDKASRMTWPETASLPQDERAFRQKFWHDVVRKDAVAADAFPRRREQAFVDLALGRARTLERYVSCTDLDQQALQRLHQDDLVECSPATDALVVPAHDVLEDWAILQHMEETCLQSACSPASLEQVVGAFPALRRAYRKWLGEYLECSPAAAGRLVLAALQDSSLSAWFRDDTVVSMLLASGVSDFIQRNKQLLLADDSQLLRRLIHLLRVACKTRPLWLGAHAAAATGAFLFVPHGAAWAAVLALVAEQTAVLLPRNVGLLTGLIEDWAWGVAWWAPYPAGAENAAAIAFDLLPLLTDYRDDEQRRTVLKVIAKVPKAASNRFLQLVDRASVGDRRDRIAEDLAEILLEGPEGYAAARDFPEAVIRLAENRFRLSEADVRRRKHAYDSIELEPFFGLRRHGHLDHFPPSALRGPFHPLLRSHPRQAVTFIVNLLNHCVDWYARPRVRGFCLERPWETRLRLPDGTVVTQWCNPRLWQLYRGTSVGPYVLQCALMALEHWLLEDVCEAAPTHLKQWLLKLLRESNNVCITAVVASVATAHPRLAGIAAVSLLTCRDLVRLDRIRLVGESQRPSGISDMFPTRAEHAVHVADRKKADALAHRKQDLECLALNLQLTSHRDRVWQILDEHRAALPAPDAQNEDDRLWRLAIHRMDIRNYAPAEATPAALDQAPQHSEPEEAPRDSSEAKPVLLEMQLPDADLREMVDEQAPANAAFDARLSLFMWATKVFQREDQSHADPDDWRRRLAAAREAAGVTRGETDGIEMLDGGPAVVAAVCIRDHWDDMSPADREWCVEAVCDVVESDCDSIDEVTRVSAAHIDASRPAAFVLAAVLAREVPGELRQRVRHSLACGLTHAVDQVLAFAAEGVGVFLAATEAALTDLCIGALAMRANLLDDLLDQDGRRRFDRRRGARQLELDVAPRVRDALVNGDCDCKKELAALRSDAWYGRHTMPLIMAILGANPTSATAREFFTNVARLIAKWWLKSASPHTDPDEDDERRPIELEHECLERLARFVLRLPTSSASEVCAQLLDAVAVCPDEAADFVRYLVIAEDRMATREPFWAIWRLFADRFARASWIADLDEAHQPAHGLLDTMFFGLEWKKGVRHWSGLAGYAQHVDAFFERLPACAPVLDAYVRFLYQIGERSLPDAFVIISRRLQQGDARAMLREPNTVFCLQVLLARHAYGNPYRLKSNPALRAAVLHLLDELVESGSSAAYRTRDDFVTPLAPTSTGG